MAQGVLRVRLDQPGADNRLDWQELGRRLEVIDPRGEGAHEGGRRVAAEKDQRRDSEYPPV